MNKKHGVGMYFWIDGEVDVSWYENDTRLESIRWTKGATYYLFSYVLCI